jgi:hypothetical protein
MRRPMPSCLALLVALAGAAFGTLSCNSDCGEAGCVPAVFVEGSVETQSQALLVTSCFNQRCASAELDLASAPCKKLTLSSDSRICVSAGSAGKLAVSLEVHSIGGELAFKNGDLLTLEISEKDSAMAVASVMRNVEYEAVFPNGPDCDDEPCLGANLTF